MKPSFGPDHFLWGLAGGIRVLGVAGAFWIGLAAWYAGPVTLLVALPFLLAGAGTAWAAAIRLRRRTAFSRADIRAAHKGSLARVVQGAFRLVAIIETLAIGAVGSTTFAIHRLDLLWPLIGVVVSLHFAPLGWLFTVRPYYAVAIAGTLLSAVALAAVPSGLGNVVVGLGLGLIMWLAAAHLLARSRVLARHTQQSPASA